MEALQGIANALAFLLMPNKSVDALTWYANEKADQIVTVLLDSDVPSPTGSQAVTTADALTFRGY